MHRDASTEARPWTFGQGCVVALLIVLGGGIAGIAFYVIWGTVTSAVKTAMQHPWTVPVAGEIAFLFMFLVGILLAWRKAPPVASRSLIAGGIIAGSVELNIYASRGNVPALVGHLLVVGSFYSVMFVGKAAFTALRGGKIRPDRISAWEWITHPPRTTALWWWMKSWNEASRDRAMNRYMRLLWARAIAQSDPGVGHGPLWKRRLPVTLRFEMSTGILPDGGGGEDWKTALETHVRAQLRLLPGARPEVTPEAPPDDVPDDSGNALPDDSGDDTPGEIPDERETRAPSYSRKPSRTAVKKMSGADLAPYVETILGTDPTPTQRAIMKAFHVSAPKAGDAIKTLEKPSAEVLELHAR